MYQNNHKHAEKACLMGNKKILKKRNYTLFSLRFNKKSELMNAKPCIHCFYFVNLFPVSKIIYSSSNNNLVQESISDFKSSHISKGRRQAYHNSLSKTTKC